MQNTFLGATYEFKNPSLLEKIYPYINYLEITPDSISTFDGKRSYIPNEIIDEIKALSADKKIVVHGVGLSIGSFDGYSEEYLNLLDSLYDKIDFEWHSEHLGYTKVSGESLGTMLSLPRTNETLDMICERVNEIMKRYNKEFLLENIIRIVPDYKSDFREAEFMNKISESTGCGFILDVYNLECDNYNHGFDIEGYIDELDLSKVKEIHIANGSIEDGFMLDAHCGTVMDSTIELTKKIINLPGNCVKLINYELLDEAIPLLGEDVIAEEYKRLNGIFN
ncbi:MAG: hypothetical protein HGGPFJEG_00389 [Ignavibacteria bacterium]|nr:hypothetical protein [Ignavibacteria bacterium]